MYDENNNSTGSPQLSENYKINFINLLINRNGTTKKRKEMKGNERKGRTLYNYTFETIATNIIRIMNDNNNNSLLLLIYV